MIFYIFLALVVRVPALPHVPTFHIGSCGEFGKTNRLYQIMDFAAKVAFDDGFLDDVISNRSFNFNITAVNTKCDGLVAAEATLPFFLGKGSDEGQICSSSESQPVLAVSGCGCSSSSSVASRMGSVFKIPLVSGSATSPALSNKALFPFFARVIPPDNLQGAGLAKIILHFEWKRVAVVYPVEAYAEGIARSFRESIAIFDPSVQVFDCPVQYMPLNKASDAITYNFTVVMQAAESIAQLQPRIFCLLGNSIDVAPIVRAFQELNFVNSNTVWLMSEAACGVSLLHAFAGDQASFAQAAPTNPIFEMGVGAYNWTLLPKVLKGMACLRPNPYGPRYKSQAWKQLWTGLTRNKLLGAGMPTNHFSDATFFADLAMLDQDIYSPLIFDSMTSILVAIGNLLSQNIEPERIAGKALMDAIQAARFQGLSGSIAFDEHGDRLAVYDLMNLQTLPDSETPYLVKIGQFEGAADNLMLDTPFIFADGTKTVPSDHVLCKEGFSYQERFNNCSCEKGIVDNSTGRCLPLIELALGVLAPVKQKYWYVPTLAAWDIDFQTNHNSTLREEFGPPVVQIPGLPKTMRITPYLGNTDWNADVAARQAFQMVMGRNGVPPIHGLVGAHYSSVSLPVAKWGHMLAQPQISGASTNAHLSNKEQHKYFLRTIPPDSIQGKVLWNYMVLFKIPYYILLYSAEAYGQGISEVVQDLQISASKSGTAPSGQHIALPLDSTARNRILREVEKTSRAKVGIIAHASGLTSPVMRFFRGSDFQLIYSETALSTAMAAEVQLGWHAVGPVSRGRLASRFSNLWGRLRPDFFTSTHALGRWNVDAWDQGSGRFNASEIEQSWLGNDGIPSNHALFFFDACYAFAVAFAQLVEQGFTSSQIHGEILLEAVKTVKFEGVTGSVSFDSQGDRITDFEFMSMQSIEGKPTWVKSGIYNTSENKMNLDHSSNILWVDGTRGTTAPAALLRIRCPNGHVERQQTCICETGIVEESTGRCLADSELSEASASEESTGIPTGLIVVLVLAAIVAGFAVFCIVAYMRRKRKHELDSPGDAQTTSGSWTLNWVGPHVHGSLCSSLPVNISNRRVSFKRGRQVKVAWFVNATPFEIQLFDAPDHSYVTLDALRFTKLRLPERLNAVCLRTAEADDWIPQWMCLSQPVVLTCGVAPHALVPDQVLRLHLPKSQDGNELGELKMVCGHEGLLLMMWSPASELRGMPIDEFKRFLQEVIDHPGSWECSDWSPKHSKLLVKKEKGDLTRNMYDACTNYIMPTVAKVDASYAEVRTDFGPADLFLSHVWAESAANTLESLENFDTRSEDWIGHSNQRDDYIHSVLNVGCRVWFCTCCNNQKRVKEELGKVVRNSPFARVISSPTCTKVAVISPFRALERKWCTFEFSFAVDVEKSVLFLTTAGIVQAGQVAPKALNQLAKCIANFTCADATCTSREDEEFIDEAISEMGGIGKIDANLRSAFNRSIVAAHKFTSEALEHLRQCRGGRGSIVDLDNDPKVLQLAAEGMRAQVLATARDQNGDNLLPCAVVVEQHGR